MIAIDSKTVQYARKRQRRLENYQRNEPYWRFRVGQFSMQIPDHFSMQLNTSENLAYRVARYVVILRNLANAFTISRRQSNLPDRLHHQHLLHKLPDSNTSDSMVEGGSKLHADHPRKWVIFARRFTLKAALADFESPDEEDNPAAAESV